MAGITGQGTTYNLPNFVGELFGQTPEDTPFLSTIGGLTGGRRAGAARFTWQTYDLRDASQDRVRLEGADAPDADNRVRATRSNVTQIVQEKVEISYSKLSYPDALASIGSSHPQTAAVAGMNPVENERAFQTSNALKSAARDIEWSFVNGILVEPADNATARRTKGILAAAGNVASATAVVGSGAAAASTDVVTLNGHGLSNTDPVVLHNVSAPCGLRAGQVYYVRDSTTNTFKLAATSGGAAIDITADATADVYPGTTFAKGHLEDLMQDVYDNGGLAESATATIMVGSTVKRKLSNVYVPDATNTRSRNVGGVNLQTLETDFGVLNVMLNRHMPNGAIAVVSLEQCAPRFAEVPGKGFMFLEPLSKTGAAEKDQLYGEIGLEYGNELAHGVLTGII